MFFLIHSILAMFHWMHINTSSFDKVTQALDFLKYKMAAQIFFKEFHCILSLRLLYFCCITVVLQLRPQLGSEFVLGFSFLVKLFGFYFHYLLLFFLR